MAYLLLVFLGGFSLVFAQTPNCTSGEGTLTCKYIDASSIEVLQDALDNMADGPFSLSISYSNVTSFPDAIFENSDLAGLGFSQNNLHAIPTNLLNPIQSQVTSLSFDDEYIDAISKEDLDLPFKGYLQYLSIYRNLMEWVDPGSFIGYSSLETLILSSNQLSYIPNGVFDGLSAVTDLELWKSYVGQIDVQALSGLTGLQTLSMQDNQLTTLQNGTFDGLPDFQLTFFGNQWNCDCALQWFKDWLTRTGQLNSSGALCATPVRRPFSDWNFCP